MRFSPIWLYWINRLHSGIQFLCTIILESIHVVRVETLIDVLINAYFLVLLYKHSPKVMSWKHQMEELIATQPQFLEHRNASS